MSMKIVVAGREYCLREEKQIILKKVSVFGNEFHVTDMDGNLLLKMGGSPSFFRTTKWIKDPRRNDEILFTVSKKLWSLRGSWTAAKQDINNAESTPAVLFKVKESHFCCCKVCLAVYFGTEGCQEGEAPRATLTASCDEVSARISDGDRLIAEMKRKVSFMSVLCNKEKAVITVIIGTDYSFISALVFILLEFSLERTAAFRFIHG